jgi:hypothetical protein
VRARVRVRDCPVTSHSCACSVDPRRGGKRTPPAGDGRAYPGITFIGSIQYRALLHYSGITALRHYGIAVPIIPVQRQLERLSGAAQRRGLVSSCSVSSKEAHLPRLLLDNNSFP